VIPFGASLLMAFHPVVILVSVGIFLRRLFEPRIRVAGSPRL